MAHFLLIHGACMDGTCWDRLVPLLMAAGHSASAPDLPCDDLTAGLEDYAAAAIAAVPEGASDLVVVGHSLGALTAPLVATRVPTRRMVLLAGIIGAPGASLGDLAERDADRDLPLGGALVFDESRRYAFSEAGARELLYHDCTPEDADFGISHGRYQRSLWGEPANFEAWPDCEIVSITCRGDRVVNPEWSDRTARERLGVEPVRLDVGHMPMFADPAALADVLTAGL
jgi:pimeloyl-ACP methyl ester carboxylesterase